MFRFFFFVFSPFFAKKKNYGFCLSAQIFHSSKMKNFSRIESGVKYSFFFSSFHLFRFAKTHPAQLEKQQKKKQTAREKIFQKKSERARDIFSQSTVFFFLVVVVRLRM